MLLHMGPCNCYCSTVLWYVSFSEFFCFAHLKLNMIPSLHVVTIGSCVHVKEDSFHTKKITVICAMHMSVCPNASMFLFKIFFVRWGSGRHFVVSFSWILISCCEVCNWHQMPLIILDFGWMDDTYGGYKRNKKKTRMLNIHTRWQFIITE